MSYKVNIFYPFDKGFFGKTLSTFKNEGAKITQTTELKQDSVDDMIKYFKDKCVKMSFERTPFNDSYEAPIPIGRFKDFPGIF